MFSLYSSYLSSVTVHTYPSLADHQLQLKNIHAPVEGLEGPLLVLASYLCGIGIVIPIELELLSLAWLGIALRTYFSSRGPQLFD